MNRLILIGSVLVDVTVRVAHLPRTSEDVVAQEHRIAPGGGFNVLAQARRMGLPAFYAGRVGTGPMGALVAEALRDIVIPRWLPAFRERDTGFVVAMVDEQGQPTYVTAPGAECGLNLTDLRCIALLPGDMVYISGYDLLHPGMGEEIAAWLGEISSPPGLTVVCDPGPLVHEIPRARWRSVSRHPSLLSLNVAEMRRMTGSADLQDGIRQLASEFKTVVVRDGASGAMCARGPLAPQQIAARPAQVVDATGAGDIHTATLLALLDRTVDLEFAVRGANIAASLAVERWGSSCGPTWDELLAEWSRMGDGLPPRLAGGVVQTKLGVGRPRSRR